MALADYAASNLADKYDDWAKLQHKELEEFVTDNPQWYNVWFAWNLANSIDLTGLVAVDLLRLGEGAAEGWETGRVMPVIADVGRAATVVGPLARGLGAVAMPVARAAGLARGRMFFKTLGMAGPCVPTTMDRALIIAGQGNWNGRLFVRFADYLRALGMSPEAFTAARKAGGLVASKLLPFLTAAGKKVTPISGIDSPAALEAFVKQADGVVVFSIRFVKNVAGKSETVGHSMLVYKDMLGRVVWNNGYGGTYRSLAEVFAYFRGTAGAMKPASQSVPLLVEQVAPISGKALRLVDGGFATGLSLISGVAVIETAEGPELAVQMGIPPQEDPKSVTPGVLKAAVGAAAERAAGKPVMRMPPIAVVGTPERPPPRPDWLTGVQWRLNALGLGAGPVDGVMGRRTRAAVVRFQREQTKGGIRLAVDGIPDPLTQKRLVEVLVPYVVDFGVNL
jgi:hypothetical protein